MELLRTLCVIWGLVYAAEAQLQCHHCADDTDPSCAFAPLKNCAQGEVCMTSTQELGFIPQPAFEPFGFAPKTVSRRCVPVDRCGANGVTNKPFKAILANFGKGNGVMIGMCCNTNGCNEEIMSVDGSARDLVPNGKRCFTCNSTDDLQCDRILPCFGARTQCTHGTLIVPPFMVLQRAVGCVTPSWCETPNLQLTFFSPLATLSQFVAGPVCCDGDFCNVQRTVVSHGSASISHLTMPGLSLLTLAIWLWTFTHAQ